MKLVICSQHFEKPQFDPSKELSSVVGLTRKFNVTSDTLPHGTSLYQPTWLEQQRPIKIFSSARNILLLGFQMLLISCP